MRTYKLILWIFILYIIQNVFYPVLSLSGYVPELLMCFAVSYSSLERRFRRISPVIIICAILSGTGTGRVFSIAVLFVGLAGVAVYLAMPYMQFIPKTIRVGAMTAFFAFLMYCAEFFAVSGTLTYGFITNFAVWNTLYTVICVCVIYLILKKIMNTADKTLLIVSERN